MDIEEGTGDGGTEGGQFHRKKNGALTNGSALVIMNDSADPSSGESKDLRTYKRRRLERSSSESKVLESGRVSDDAACHFAEQESDACNLDRWRCNSQERQLPDATQLTYKPSEGVGTNEPPNESKSNTATAMCQRVLSDILASKEFASLSKLLSENFQGCKVENLSPFSCIQSRMKEGAYESSPILFSTGIQAVWKRLQSIGEEMISLSKSLSNLSRTSYGEQFCAQESESHAKAENLATDGVYEICLCKQCGEKTDGGDSLACDYCEDLYHVSCIQPAVREIPQKSWYCVDCMCEKGTGLPHENCVVCERLNAQRTQLKNNNGTVGISKSCEQAFNEFEENSSCNMDDSLHQTEEQKDSDICRICGTGVENGGRFITCDHPYCPHKYYHMRCLTTKQLKMCGTRWYCPSCLCRDCLTDKDDDKIVLCDGCDNAYHIYCLKPPRTMIPEGNWFCGKCEVAFDKIHRAKRAYKKVGNLPKLNGGDGERTDRNFGKKRCKQSIEDLDKGSGGVEMLLNAANTLSYREQMAADQMND